jgi:protein-tyrosine phosphatase
VLDSGLIDLHCHLLPGLDDGARDLPDAVAMAEQAQADGIAAICATPHIREDHPVRIDELQARRDELTAALSAAGCATRVLAGGEVAASTVAALEERELVEVSLGGAGRWVLLEPGAGPLDDRCEQAVESLRGRGFRALVAHPERHLTPDIVERLRRLIGRGALAQATAASLLDPATGAGMLGLARAGVIHVLGSDAHSAQTGRPVALTAALRCLRDVEGVAEHLGWVASAAPHGIVTGRELTAPFGPGSE